MYLFYIVILRVYILSVYDIPLDRYIFFQSLDLFLLLMHFNIDIIYPYFDAYYPLFILFMLDMNTCKIFPLLYCYYFWYIIFIRVLVFE